MDPTAAPPTETSPPSASSPPSAPPAPERREGPLRLVFGLFVVPLIVVLLCVAVFIGFGWVAYERQGVSDYLNDLQSFWPNRRWQAAYELSKILAADPEALNNEPGAVAEVRRQFADAVSDPRVRRYLALVLGRTRDRQALPLLTQAAAASNPDPETRIYALWSLGAIGDPAALPALREALTDSDAGVRKTAAFALGSLGDPRAVSNLEPLLADPVPDVRWNAALALARLGSPAGVAVLEQMLDRSLLAQVPGITSEQQEEAMISAIGALAAARGDAARPLLDRLAESDPSLKVRQAALAARKALGEG
ncbi:MAG TPA: HEAT repeat domain-containing protein [Thermoanaerobaculia bacterium]|nr:HEAT repeat domain-containing protein [Thermoanaerobaculia bacterium]